MPAAPSATGSGPQPRFVLAIDRQHIEALLLLVHCCTCQLHFNCWLRAVAPRDELAIKGRVRWDQCAAAWGCTQNGNHQGSTTVLRKERGKPEPWDQLRGSCLQPLRAFRRDRGVQRSSGGLCAACPTPPAAPHTIVITKLRDARPLRSLSHSLTLVPRSHRRHPRV